MRGGEGGEGGDITDKPVFSLSGGRSVQKQSIPALLEGRDALVRSQTGSGQSPFNFGPSFPGTKARVT